MTDTASKKKISRQVGNTRVTPITSRIIFVFIIFILAASFASNYINLAFTRAELIKMMKELLVKDLKEVYDFSNTQYELYQFSKNNPGAFDSSMEMIKSNALRQFKNQKPVTLGLRVEGGRGNGRARIIFQASKITALSSFNDLKAVRYIQNQQRKGFREGALTFFLYGEEYYGVYKYHPKWDFYLIRAEELKEFTACSRRIFRDISAIIVLITLACALVGIFMIRRITRFIDRITGAIMEMIHTQQMDLIPLEGASSDNITFLGMAFNSLSSTINNLLTIFRKFVNQDIAAQAYREKVVRLEGAQKELTVLFSDIKGFTYMTETLGADIIKILNLHYHQAIREIFKNEGLIGSIIGDALLAVFGIQLGSGNAAGSVEGNLSKSNALKSYQAVMAGYGIQEVARALRAEMQNRRAEILRLKGSLTEEEERVYQAVLLEVGVGIDGGTVFYGNIGSYERMTNTVIGDNVNAAARLEGLTRIYQVPVICSEYVKNDITQNYPDHGLDFLELDTVQVKGKTIGQKIYWPIINRVMNPDGNMTWDLKLFATGLQLYYQGQWEDAAQAFGRCKLPPAAVFAARTSCGKAPENWSGIWTLTEK
ncbi:MAG: adenylate/guanylate cyclase domain-containing protein [Firmicutes bacterium]|nr:adenylate/guanylate cyclase domain-containing protein [Bacillota bacterium]